MKSNLSEFKCYFPDISIDLSYDNDYVYIIDRYRKEDFIKDEYGTAFLKNNAQPYKLVANGHSFDTIEEMLMFIDLNYPQKVKLMIDCKQDIADKIINVWQKNYRKE